MAFDDKIKALLRRYYVFERMSLEQAAEKAEVSFNTARRWKKQALDKGDDWEKVREAQVMAGGELHEVSKGLLTGFLIEYNRTMEELQKSVEVSPIDKAKTLCSLADSFTKMTAASKRILPDVSELAIAMKTVEYFGTFLQEKHPELLSSFLDVVVEFGNVINQSFQKEK